MSEGQGWAVVLGASVEVRVELPEGAVLGEYDPRSFRTDLERNSHGETVALGFLMRSLTTRLAAERDLRQRYESERFVSRLAADILTYPLGESEKSIEHALRTIHQRFGASSAIARSDGSRQLH